MKKIGILCATDKELSPYFSIIQNKKTKKYAMHSFYTGKIADVEVVVAEPDLKYVKRSGGRIRRYQLSS